MNKKNNIKNIIISNLPAALALILMAVALKLTLKFSFILSLIVLVVLYFLLGVVIELIMEKLEARKKKENIFKQFSEGGRSNLPTGRSELFNTEVQEDASEEDEDDYESPVFPDQEEDTEEVVIEKKPIEPVKTSSSFQVSYSLEEDFSEESEEVPEEEDSFVLVNDLEEVPEETVEETLEESVETETEVEAEIEEEPVVEAVEEPFIDSDDFTVNVSFGEDEEVSEEPIEIKDEITDIENISEEDIFAEEIEVEPVNEFTLEDIPTDEASAIGEAIEETSVAPVENLVEEPRASIEDNLEVNDDLYDVLKEVGAISEMPVDNTPVEEKEARRSLFEGSDFDAGIRSSGKTSLVFGSVPDTEDDLEFIPPVIESSNAPKKGKVQVDSKKIDELYAFKKANAGESFFGKKRKR